MNHQPYLDWMQLELDGGLTAADRAALDAHVQTCAECEATWSALRSVEELLQVAPTLAPRPGFTGRFKARLTQRTSRTHLFLGLVTLGTGALSASALMVVVLVGAALSFTDFAQQPATTTVLMHASWQTFLSVSAVVNAFAITLRSLANWVMANPAVLLVGPFAGFVLTVWIYFLAKFKPAPMRAL